MTSRVARPLALARSDVNLNLQETYQEIAKPILVCLMANAHYKIQTYRPTDNA